MASPEALIEEAPAEDVVEPDAPADDTATADTPDESIVDKIMDLFQSNEVTVEYGTDPKGWVEENLPEGTEAGDVARCMPDVTERLGGPYQANAVRYNAGHGAHGHPATQTVVNEISYTYNTVYQQNAFINAEEGAQVTNIQGDGNHVDQTQIDVEFNVDTGSEDEQGEVDDLQEVEDLEQLKDVDELVDPTDDDGEMDDDGHDGEMDPETGQKPAMDGPEAGDLQPVDNLEADWSPEATDGWDKADHAAEAMEPVDQAMDSPEAAPEANPFDGAEEFIG
jgi:hypothetical protein